MLQSTEENSIKIAEVFKKSRERRNMRKNITPTPKNVCTNRHNSGSVQLITQCEEENINSYFFKKQLKMTGELLGGGGKEGE